MTEKDRILKAALDLDNQIEREKQRQQEKKEIKEEVDSAKAALHDMRKRGEITLNENQIEDIARLNQFRTTIKEQRKKRKNPKRRKKSRFYRNVFLITLLLYGCNTYVANNPEEWKNIQLEIRHFFVNLF